MSRTVIIHEGARPIADEIESRLHDGEWRKFWLQTMREADKDGVLLAKPKHLLLAFAKIQNRRKRP